MEGAEQMLGYAHAIKDTEEMLLNRLYLDERARGTGLAALLLDAIETQCRSAGQRKLRLSVFERMPAPSPSTSVQALRRLAPPHFTSEKIFSRT